MKNKTQKPLPTIENQNFALEQEEQYQQSTTINPEEYLEKLYWSGEDCERLFFVNEVAFEDRRTRKQKNFLKYLTNAIDTGELNNLNKSAPFFDSAKPFSLALQALFTPSEFKSWINHSKTQKQFDRFEIKTPKKVSLIFKSLKPALNSSIPPEKKGKKVSPLQELVKSKVFEILNTGSDITISNLVNNTEITKLLAPDALHTGVESISNREYKERYSKSRRSVSVYIREAKNDFRSK
ncbi:MAG: hypothetical protein HOD90_05860 [Nitrospina sp.]|jgi:hypothetical protein|nr:hypothetical protein [Nitrospina sp.]